MELLAGWLVTDKMHGLNRNDRLTLTEVRDVGNFYLSGKLTRGFCTSNSLPNATSILSDKRF